MARYPVQQNTIIIREINADTYATFLDYWLETELLKYQCDELHTIWNGPAPALPVPQQEVE
jgi:hypothetical protein